MHTMARIPGVKPNPNGLTQWFGPIASCFYARDLHTPTVQVTATMLDDRMPRTLGVNSTLTQRHEDPRIW